MNKHHIFVIVNLIGFLPLMWLTVTFSLLPIWIILCAFGLIYAIATRDKSIDFNLTENWFSQCFIQKEYRNIGKPKAR